MLRDVVLLFCGSSHPKAPPPRWMTHCTRSGVTCPGFPPPRPPRPATGAGPRPATAPLPPAAAPLPARAPRPALGGIMGGSSPSIHTTDLRRSPAFLSQSDTDRTDAPLAVDKISFRPRFG